MSVQAVLKLSAMQQQAQTSDQGYMYSGTGLQILIGVWAFYATVSVTAIMPKVENTAEHGL